MSEQKDLKPVTQEEVLNRVRGLGGRIIKTAIIAAVAAVVLMPVGLALGGWAGAAVASHFALGWWATAGAVTLGVGAGGVGAFFGTKMLVADRVTELVVGTGLTAGEMGLRELLRLLKQARSQKPGAEAQQPATLEKAVEKTHKGVTWLRNFFGETAEKKANPPPPANVPVADAPPALPKQQQLKP
jgi:hypothetical protein